MTPSRYARQNPSARYRGKVTSSSYLAVSFSAVRSHTPRMVSSSARAAAVSCGAVKQRLAQEKNRFPMTLPISYPMGP